jgi:uncharacterized membrane protein YoaK (UPF0700 family)
MHATPVPPVTSFRGLQITPKERIGLLIAVLLSASAGGVDIIAYLEFAHVFVANMTGNTILGASELVGGDFSKAITHLLPIVTFVAGVVSARIWLVQKEQSESPRVGFCLCLISGLWVLLALLIPNLGTVLIPVLAFGVGAQNATLLHVDKIPVNTAFITGNLEKLGETIASLFRKTAGRDERVKLIAFGAIWISYALGAALAALAAQHIGRRSLVIPACILCVSGVLVLITHFRSSK